MNRAQFARWLLHLSDRVASGDSSEGSVKYVQSSLMPGEVEIALSVSVGELRDEGAREIVCTMTPSAQVFTCIWCGQVLARTESVRHAASCERSAGAYAIEALKTLETALGFPTTARLVPALAAKATLDRRRVEALVTHAENRRLAEQGVGQMHERDCPTRLKPHATCPESPPEPAEIVERIEMCPASAERLAAPSSHRPHVNADGKFQSDKYPTTPPGKCPLSLEDPTAQDLLWVYAERRRAVDAQFADDLQSLLVDAGFDPEQLIPSSLVRLAAGVEAVIEDESLTSGQVRSRLRDLLRKP